MNDHVTAYPLNWPSGWPRTDPYMQDYSRFSQTPNSARIALLNEIRLLVGDWKYDRDKVILSTDIKLRLDGEPYAGLKAPDDTGVAVYFTYKKRPMVFACDRWQKLHDNIYAIANTIEALRGIERWGASDMLERAFTGFTALPSPDTISMPHWRTVFETESNDFETVRAIYRRKRSEHHPDTGGNTELFDLNQEAWRMAKQELTL